MKDLALHILDITQNAIKAKATCIGITVDEKSDESLVISITDNGSGMSQDMLNSVTDPYTTSRTTRKVGLGIPLFKQNAERTGGQLTIDSQLSKGTNLVAEFNPQHIDCLPMGDLSGVVALLVNANPNINFKYTHTANDKNYVFDTIEVKDVLGDTPINAPEIHLFIKDMIKENIQDLYNYSN